MKQNDVDIFNIIKASAVPTLILSSLHPFDIIKTRF